MGKQNLIILKNKTHMCPNCHGDMVHIDRVITSVIKDSDIANRYRPITIKREPCIVYNGMRISSIYDKFLCPVCREMSYRDYELEEFEEILKESDLFKNMEDRLNECWE